MSLSERIQKQLEIQTLPVFDESGALNGKTDDEDIVFIVAQPALMDA